MKNCTIWCMEHLSMSRTEKVIHRQKQSVFFGPPCIYIYGFFLAHPVYIYMDTVRVNRQVETTKIFDSVASCVPTTRAMPRECCTGQWDLPKTLPSQSRRQLICHIWQPYVNQLRTNYTNLTIGEKFPNFIMDMELYGTLRILLTQSDTLGVTVLWRLDYLDIRFRNCPWILLTWTWLASLVQLPF